MLRLLNAQEREGIDLRMAYSLQRRNNGLCFGFYRHGARKVQQPTMSHFIADANYREESI